MKLNSLKVTHIPYLKILGLAVSLTFLGACASLSPKDNGADQAATELYQEGLDSWQNDDPLFTHWIPRLDPASHKMSGAKSSLLSHILLPRIEGKLPGQPELSDGHFEEVAVPYANATVTFTESQEDIDIWQRIRNGFALPSHTHKDVLAELRWYARHPAYINRVADRAERYLHLIVEEAEKRDMPLEIALLPIVESAFQPFAYSHGRAAGIWQFIPSTGRLYGLKQNWWYDGRRDIDASTKAALNFLTRLKRSFKGDWLLALAAYNSGAGTVSRAIRKNKRKGKPTDFFSLDLPKETRGYVPKLLAISSIIEDPQKYGISLQPIANKPVLEKVDTKKQIDLALAAELADITVEELYMLNPGFNRWATDPKGPHHLLVPIENADIFRENLAALPDNKRVHWERHRIRDGQNLLSIADKYNTTVSLIKDINNIRGNMIRAGQSLIIPVAVKNKSQYVLSAEQRLASLQNTKRSGKQKIKYTVRPGDTLWDISRKHKVGVRSLAKWNGLAPRDTLRAGQKLVIWTKYGQRVASSKTSFSPHSKTQKIRYRVRRGDSLARIADKFNIRIHQVMRWNNLKKGVVLQPGQRLTLHVDVTRQAGV